MPSFHALSPHAEISGKPLLGMLAALEMAGAPVHEPLALLAKAGVLDPEPEGWYPQQAILTVLEEAAKRWGPGILHQAGRAIPRTARFPPEIDSLERALLTLDLAYQVNHRGGLIGHYLGKRLGPKALELLCDNPYGCDFDEGILAALIEWYGPAGEVPAVAHAPGTGCRREGAAACAYRITW